MRQKDYFEAYIDGYDKVVVYMSKQSYEGKSARFYLKDSKEQIIELKICSIEDTQNNYRKYILEIEEELTIGEEYYVYHEHARKTIAEYSYIVKTAGTDCQIRYCKSQCKRRQNEIHDRNKYHQRRKDKTHDHAHQKRPPKLGTTRAAFKF